MNPIDKARTLSYIYKQCDYDISKAAKITCLSENWIKIYLKVDWELDATVKKEIK